MTYTWIICGGLGIVAGWFFACFRHYKRKWKDAVAEKDNLEKQNESNKKLAKKMMQECRDLCELCQCGWRNLQYRAYRDRIEVVGVYGKNLYFTVKPISFDADDPEDREFAIREAAELIETIQKF